LRHPTAAEKNILKPFIEKCVRSFPGDKNAQQKCLNEVLIKIGRTSSTVTLTKALDPPPPAHIYIEGGQNDVISGNEFDDTDRPGIELRDSKNETMADNKFEDNSTKKPAQKKPD
jgi:parallel beta-helix repeat protein